MSLNAKHRGQPLFRGWQSQLEHFAKLLAADVQPQAALVRALLDQKPPEVLEAARAVHKGFGSGWYEALTDAFDPPQYTESSLTYPGPSGACPT